VVVEGVKGVAELCRSGWEVVRIYAVPERFADVPSTHADVISPCSHRDMDRMSALRTAPGVLAVATLPVYAPTGRLDAAACPLILGLDGISDPGNVGTLIRTALWFGCAEVWADARGADPWSAKSIQAAMGATFHLPVREVDLASSVRASFLPCWVLDAGGSAQTMPLGELLCWLCLGQAHRHDPLAPLLRVLGEEEDAARAQHHED
jgi:TrmH family RNA methyltransferase